MPDPIVESSARFKTQVSAATGETTQTTSLPVNVTKAPKKPSMMDHATPTAKVSAFCRAVLAHLIPSEFWGTGDAEAHNERRFLRSVDRFIEMRRFESLTLHEVMQGIKVSFPSPPTSSHLTN